MTAPDSSVSAGIFGFLAFFFIGVALWLLMRSMSGKIQNIEYDRRDTELREGDEAGATGAPPAGPADGAAESSSGEAERGAEANDAPPAEGDGEGSSGGDATDR